MELTIYRTNSDNKDFKNLVSALDKDLQIRDGEEHSFFAQFNKIDTIKQVVVAYENNVAIGCGAIKEYNATTMEIKRMYVLPEKRGIGVASAILVELEKWTLELAYHKCILETGEKQPEAIALYLKNGYKLIPNYGQYIDVMSSKCFEKVIS